jgi:hypothetical protein
MERSLSDKRVLLRERMRDADTRADEIAEAKRECWEKPPYDAPTEYTKAVRRAAAIQNILLELTALENRMDQLIEQTEPQ